MGINIKGINYLDEERFIVINGADFTSFTQLKDALLDIVAGDDERDLTIYRPEYSSWSCDEYYQCMKLMKSLTRTRSVISCNEFRRESIE